MSRPRTSNYSGEKIPDPEGNRTMGHPVQRRVLCYLLDNCYMLHNRSLVIGLLIVHWKGDKIVTLLTN